MPTPRQPDRPADDGAATHPRIVVGVDGSPGARLALAWALAEAARRGAELLVLSSFPVEAIWLDPGYVDPRRVEAIREDTEDRARGLVEEVLGDPDVSAVAGTADVPVRVVAVPGPAAPNLVEHATRAELLVVGSRGRGGIRSTVLGSVALHCATHAACPVVVVHAAAGSAPEGATAPRVVVGLDDSPHAEAVLVTAVAAAARRGARVEAVLAYEEPNPWSEMYAVMTRAPGQSRARALEFARGVVAEALGEGQSAVDVTVLEGPAGEMLARRAAGADLLVVGSRSRNTLTGMVLGSVALHCVIHAPCPVLVVRPGAAPAPRRTQAAAEPVALG
ncbi:universal stress protein [Blastococcus sp. SYSU DS1024]